MSAISVPVSNVRSPGHAWFESHWPELRSRARAFAGQLPAHDRDEAEAEVLTHCFTYALSAARRGKLQALTPFALVWFFGRSFREGRRTTGTSTTDALSEAAQRRRGFTVVSLDTDHDAENGTVRVSAALANRTAEQPLENVRRDVDYSEILDRQRASRKARRVFQFLAETAGAGQQRDLAKELGVTAARVTQLKGELADRLAVEDYFPSGMRPSERAAWRQRQTRTPRYLRRHLPLNAATSPPTAG